MHRMIIAVLLGLIMIAGCGGEQESGQRGEQVEPLANYDGATVSDLGTQTEDPVTGEPTSKDIYVDYRGMRIYFADQDSLASFEMDPDEYVRQMSAKGVIIQKSPPK